MLLDADGRAVAASERERLGTQHRSRSYYVEAVRSNDTVFTTYRQESGGIEFNYSRRVEISGELIGVIVVGVDLRKFETACDPCHRKPLAGPDRSAGA